VAQVDIPAPHGHLEGLLWTQEAPRGAALVCHPHPLAGGSLHNTVTYRMASAFRTAGCSVLRFNFRGVGASTGAYDSGPGELEDARTALDWLEGQVPGVPLAVAGFSFGARTALELAAVEPRVARVLAVGMATRLFDLSVAESLHQPVGVIQSLKDEFASIEDVRALVARIPHARLFELAEADHLVTGKEREFDAVCTRAVHWLLEAM
jgi:uncharacterized protein